MLVTQDPKADSEPVRGLGKLFGTQVGSFKSKRSWRRWKDRQRIRRKVHNA